ncbi:MAG TPA: hypothetical protein VHN36_08285 [Ilumatobacteraceae bacterium]|nr:hypothetical protein [Ilumatobacteraceae bacterium]
MMCSIAAIVLMWLTNPGVVVAQDSGPPTTEDVIFVHVCDLDAPVGWTVIEEASALNTRVVVCNFRVDVEAYAGVQPAAATTTSASPPTSSQSLFGVFDPAVAGVAITVEYFCTAAEGNEAFAGKTGPRDTETFPRTPTKVVTEEGPAAATAAGRERDRIVSSFFPDTDFTLQEKAWIMFNPQTVATIVVITNDRAVGIDNGAEAAALVVAANHTPKAEAGCDIAPVAAPSAGATGGLGGNRDGEGGGGGGRIGIVLGTGAVVTVGGVVVWRRRKKPGRVVPRANLGHVPPQCVGHEQAYEHVRERLITLEEAFQDMNENLHTAEKNHHYNKLRTLTILGLDAGTTIGGAVGSAFKLRPSARRSVPLQADTWKPPLNLDPRLANILKRAQDVLDAVSARVAGLRNQLAGLKKSLGNLADLPQVRAARERAVALGAAVERAVANLTGSKAARAAIDAVDEKITTVSAAAAANAERVAGLERMVERQRGWLAGAADDVAKLTDTVDGGNVGAPRLGPVNPKLELKQAQLARMRTDLKKTLEELEGARLNATDASKNVDTLMGQRDGHMRDLARFGDVDERDVAKLRERHTNAMTEANANYVGAASDLNQRARAAQGALSKAEMEESLAATFRKNVASQIDLRTALPPPGLARKVLHGTVELVSLPFLPILWVFEKGFGRVQSLPEAFEILIRGEKRVAELTRQLTMVERAVTQQRAEARRLRGLLDQCVKQWSGAA